MKGSLRSWLTRRNLLVAAAVFVFGSLIGVSIFTFYFAKGFTYFQDDPAVCASCHIMEDQYHGYQASSHAAVATCNDCHAPHTNIVEKYFAKGVNGFNHGLAFTTGWHEENLQITDFNRNITLDACLYCHADYVGDAHAARPNGEQIDCLQCHAEVGHP